MQIKKTEKIIIVVLISVFLFGAVVTAQEITSEMISEPVVEEEQIIEDPVIEAPIIIEKASYLDSVNRAVSGKSLLTQQQREEAIIYELQQIRIQLIKMNQK